MFVAVVAGSFIATRKNRHFWHQLLVIFPVRSIAYNTYVSRTKFSLYIYTAIE
jgi:hypothetical protein